MAYYINISAQFALCGVAFTLGSADLAIYYADFAGDGTYTKLTDPSSYGLSWGDWSTGVNGVTSRTLTFGEDATEGKYYIVTTPTDQAKNGGGNCASNCDGYYAVVDHTAPTVTFTDVDGNTNYNKYNENTGYYYFNKNARIALKIEDNDSTLTYAAPDKENGTYDVGNVVVEVYYEKDYIKKRSYPVYGRFSFDKPQYLVVLCGFLTLHFVACRLFVA